MPGVPRGVGAVTAPLATDVHAGGVPLTVVAAKKPGQWIVRAMSPFVDVAKLRRNVEEVVGVLDPDLEWTHHTYGGWPAYVVYGQGDLRELGWPTGVFRFCHKGGDVYGPAERLRDVR